MGRSRGQPRIRVGGLLGLVAYVLHTFRDIARNPLIQGSLFFPWSSRLWVSSTDAFCKPEEQPRGRVFQFFRHRGRIVFFEEGNDLSIHAAMVSLSRKAYSIAQAVWQTHDEFILILRALF